MAIREIVLDEIHRVGREQKKTLVKLDDNLPLFKSGLDSLCFVILVANLEKALGIDPFNNIDDGDSLPQTVGDLIRFYEDYRQATLGTSP